MPPEKLYKYQPFSDYAIENLANANIFFSHPEDFNDPFEFHVRWKHVDLTPDQEGSLHLIARFQATRLGLPFDPKDFDPKGFADELALGQKQAHEDLSRMGVACFSELHRHPLLWAHYASGHTGFCLEFSGDSEVFSRKLQVEYQPSVPEVDPADFTYLPHDPFKRLRVLAATKVDCWSYEKEWRVLHAEGATTYGYEPKDLTGVYFGLRMKEGHKITIASLLQKTPTRFYAMDESQEGYGLVEVPVSFDQPDYKRSEGPPPLWLPGGERESPKR